MSDCNGSDHGGCSKEVDPSPELGGSFSDILYDMKGTLVIKVKDAQTGKIVEEKEITNLIMTFTRLQMSYLFAGVFLPAAATNERYITRFQVGTNGTTETVTDPAITNPVSVTPLEVTYPTTSSVMFTGVLASGSGNGVTFREAGLLFGSPSGLATRKAFAPMEKSSLWVWEINWTLAFI